MTGLKKLLMWKAASGGGTAPQTETLSGSLVTFETTKARPLTQCRVDFLPKQSGSGDPSPENVRPISGWDGCTVYRAGKNLFDGYLENKNINVDGSEGGSSTRLATPFEPIRAGTYTVSFDSDFSCALYVYSSDQAETLITEESNMVWNTSPMTFDITNGKYYRIKFKHNTDKSIVPSDLTDVQVEVGSTATPYEPYTATTYPITWQSAGTVYGGYVDLVRGVLVAEWSNIASYDGETLPGVWISDRDIYATGTTPTTGAQVAYQLATPITYTLTPQQITALIGTNNIWSDAGDVTVTYTK